MTTNGMPGEFEYKGDCGVTPKPTNTVSGSGAGPVGPEGMHEVPFVGGSEKNILSDPPSQHSAYATGKVPD